MSWTRIFAASSSKVLPVLVKEEIGVLGMKPMASGAILQSKTATPIECLHYAMNLPTSTVITGIERMEILDQALEAARTFKPLSREAVSAIAGPHGGGGGDRPVRRLQDHRRLRRHRTSSGMVGLTAKSFLTP